MSEIYKNPQDGCMEWDDVIESDAPEFIILPEGDYDFTVVNFERGRFPGGPKVPACNKATVTLEVKTDKGMARIRTDLLLYRTLEWRISAFFRCLGIKKQGERLAMDWNNVIGACGRAHFKPRTYTKDGEERQVNDVVRFYPCNEEKYVAPPAQADEDDNDDLPF